MIKSILSGHSANSMPHLRWQHHLLPVFQVHGFARNLNLSTAFHTRHQHVKRCAMVAQPLVLVKGEQRHATARVFQQNTADDRLILILHQGSGWMDRKRAWSIGGRIYRYTPFLPVLLCHAVLLTQSG